MLNKQNSRREFLKKSAAGTAAVMAGIHGAKTGRAKAPATGAVLGANDTVVCGFIGVGGQGFNAHLLNVTKPNQQRQATT